MAREAQIFRRAAAVELRRLTGAGILIDADGNHFGVNQVGVRIWDLLDGAISLHAIVETLVREFDVPEPRCRAEAESFLAELEQRRLVERG